VRRLTLTLIILAAGCRPRDPAPPAPTQPVAAATTEFASHGVRFSYPADWSPVPDVDYVLRVAPRENADAMSIALDVPRLPPHIPGFIPLGMVVNGYVDDLRKQQAAVEIDPPVDMKLGGANARRVRSRRTMNGKTLVEDAVLAVHGDRVYILRANSEAGTGPAARDALNAILASVAWD
jgi:hypothetical protein